MQEREEEDWERREDATWFLNHLLLTCWRRRREGDTICLPGFSSLLYLSLLPTAGLNLVDVH